MKKIMFNDEYGLTQAVLERRKTQTRRIFRIGKVLNIPYQIGEEVAIVQRYADNAVLFPPSIFGKEAGYTNKMFVRPDLMPHLIKITNIRVERLQDISDEDCMKEGIMRGEFINTWDEYYFEHGCNNITAKTARDAFKKLIDKVSGKGTWESNPYVFVYDFKLIK